MIRHIFLIEIFIFPESAKFKLSAGIDILQESLNFLFHWMYIYKNIKEKK